MSCRHYLVSGRVQGVFYRASSYEVAKQLGLTGWVRNLSDGRVEALACGSDQQLSQFENWLQQGPPLAIVDKLEISQQMETTEHNEFRILYS